MGKDRSKIRDRKLVDPHASQAIKGPFLPYPKKCPVCGAKRKAEWSGMYMCGGYVCSSGYYRFNCIDIYIFFERFIRNII